jgi:formylglycine-generating enzyme required for sulfatase activity
MMMLFAVAGRGGGPQEATKPLNKNQVMALVTAGMDSKDLAKKVQQLGIDFDLTDDYVQALRKAGAQDVLIQALRAARAKPLTRQQVLELVAGGVPSTRAAAIVKQRGVEFVPDQEYLETLRVAGAEEALITVLRAAGEALSAQLVVATSPNAEVTVDGEIAGRASAQGRLTVQVKPGPHALRVSLEGKKEFEKWLTLAPRETTKIEAALTDLGPSPGPVRDNPRDGLKYVWIPSGTFMMGCSPGDKMCNPDERPLHKVTLTKGFWMGQTEVMVGAYKRFSAATGRQMPESPSFNSGWTNDRMPVVRVNWDDAHDYCAWAGGRLPSEAEWEYAARAGSPDPSPEDPGDVAWYQNNAGEQTHEVGQKQANAFGLFDILGNAWEWVNDWCDWEIYDHSPSQDPTGAPTGDYHVMRGGSLRSFWFQTRVSLRADGNPANWKPDGIGARCVADLGAPQ